VLAEEEELEELAKAAAVEVIPAKTNNKKCEQEVWQVNTMTLKRRRELISKEGRTKKRKDKKELMATPKTRSTNQKL